MFGLLRPERRLLSEDDRRDHSSAYCNLCAALSYCYGLSSRLLVVHDVATADWLLSGQHAERRLFPIANCVRGGIRSVAAPVCLSARQKFLAALSAYSVGVKVADDLADQRTAKVRLAQAMYHTTFAQARCDLAADGFDVPAFEVVLADQRRVEESDQTDLAAASAPSGNAFALVAQHLVQQHGQGMDPPDAFQLGDCIGRSVFLADACQDLERDLIVGAYNPLHPRSDRAMIEGNMDRRPEALTYLHDLLGQAHTICGRLGPGVARRWRATQGTLWSIPANASRRKRPQPAANTDAPAEERKKKDRTDSLPPPTSEVLVPEQPVSTRSGCGGDHLGACCGAMCCDAICDLICASV